MTRSLLSDWVTFHARLDDQQIEALGGNGGVPGVKSWLRRPARVEAPANAAQIVADLLVRWGAMSQRAVDATLARQRQPGQITPQALKRYCIEHTEAHPWLWAESRDRAPTGGFALTPYQREAVAFTAVRGGGNLWMPPGSGKTICAILFALLKPGPVLIVTKADARETQRRELVRCTECTPYVIKPAGKKRVSDEWHSLRGYFDDAREQGFRPVVIVGWEQLLHWTDTLLKYPFVSVVWDEIHKAKNSKREKWVLDEEGIPRARPLGNIVDCAYQIAEAVPRRVATTATPIRNRLQDIWMQLSLTEPGAWGRTVTKFGFRYCDAKPGYNGSLDMTGTSNIPELKWRLSWATLNIPHSVTHAQMPPKRRMVLHVPAARLQKAIARSRDELRAERLAEKKNKRFGRERKLMDAASMKRGFVKDLVLEHTATGKGKLIVFTGRRRDAENLASEFERRCKGVDVIMGHGGHSVTERQQMQDRYMEHPGPVVLVGTVQAWGESRNLQDTDVMVVAMLPDTPGEVDQLEGRGHRLGMNRPVLVIYPIAQGTYDETVATNLLSKLKAVEDVAKGGSIKGLSDSMRGLDRREEIMAELGSIFDDVEGEDEFGFNLE